MFLAGPWSVLSSPPDSPPATELEEEEEAGPEDDIVEGGMVLPPPLGVYSTLSQLEGEGGQIDPEREGEGAFTESSFTTINPKTTEDCRNAC